MNNSVEFPRHGLVITCGAKLINGTYIHHELIREITSNGFHINSTVANLFDGVSNHRIDSEAVSILNLSISKFGDFKSIDYGLNFCAEPLSPMQVICLGCNLSDLSETLSDRLALLSDSSLIVLNLGETSLDNALSHLIEMQSLMLGKVQYLFNSSERVSDNFEVKKHLNTIILDDKARKKLLDAKDQQLCILKRHTKQVKQDEVYPILLDAV